MAVGEVSVSIVYVPSFFSSFHDLSFYVFVLINVFC
jgi:hypothetical protein